jgi:hypothetical protein
VTRRRAIILAVAAIGVAGGVIALQIATAPLTASARDDLIELTVQAPHGPVAPGAAIDLDTTLTNLGPADRVDLSSDTAVVYFSLEKLDGTAVLDGGGSRLVCENHEVLVDRTPPHMPFVAAGAVDDSNREIWALVQPGPSTFRLPAGRWRITAHLNATASMDCSGTPHRLSAAVTLDAR